MAEWLMAPGCRPGPARVRWFESIPAHQVVRHPVEGESEMGKHVRRQKGYWVKLEERYPSAEKVHELGLSELFDVK